MGARKGAPEEGDPAFAGLLALAMQQPAPRLVPTDAAPPPGDGLSLVDGVGLQALALQVPTDLMAAGDPANVTAVDRPIPFPDDGLISMKMPTPDPELVATQRLLATEPEGVPLQPGAEQGATAARLEAAVGGRAAAVQRPAIDPIPAEGERSAVELTDHLARPASSLDGAPAQPKVADAPPLTLVAATGVSEEPQGPVATDPQAGEPLDLRAEEGPAPIEQPPVQPRSGSERAEVTNLAARGGGPTPLEGDRTEPERLDPIQGEGGGPATEPIHAKRAADGRPEGGSDQGERPPRDSDPRGGVQAQRLISEQPHPAVQTIPLPAGPSQGPAQTLVAAERPLPLQADGPLHVDQLYHQLTQAVQRAEDGRYTVDLRLYPEHLGEVKLRISLIGQQVQARFAVVNPVAVQELEVRADQLRESLRGQGLELTGFDVSADSDRASRQAKEQMDRLLSERRRQKVGNSQPSAIAPAASAGGARERRTGGFDAIA